MIIHIFGIIHIKQNLIQKYLNKYNNKMIKEKKE